MIDVTDHTELIGRGFSGAIDVRGRSSIADLFSSRRRCGVYVLWFSDGWSYAGKTIDVVKRFAQHRAHHGDIVAINFKRCGRRELNVIEGETISMLESHGARLRNRLIVELPALESDFDAVMDRDTQRRWMQNAEFDDLNGPRVQDVQLRLRTAARVQSLRQLPCYADVQSAFGNVLLSGVPAVFRSELSFWITSVLPYGSKVGLYLRLNVGFQSVFDAGYSLSRRGPYCAWWIPRELAQFGTGVELAADAVTEIFVGRKRVGVVTPSALKHGAREQVVLTLWNPDIVLDQLAEAEFLLGLRRFTMGLVRKSTCPMSRSHHPDAVDDAVDAACAARESLFD